MSRVRLALFTALSILVCAWSAAALYGHYVRLDHRGMVMAIRANNAPLPETAELNAAIADYDHAMALLPCSAPMAQDVLLLLAQAADNAARANDSDAEDAALEHTQHALLAAVACTPMNGKAWLDLASIATYREGFTPHALAAYRMSATVAPRESWLAQKRLLFALPFRPLLGDEGRRVAQADLAVLGHAHPNRINAVAKAADVASPDALGALFTAGAP